MVTVMCGINTRVAESSLELTTVLGWPPIRVKLGGRESCLYFHCVIVHVNKVTVDLEPLVHASIGVHCDQAHLLVDPLLDLAYPLTGFMDGWPAYDSYMYLKFEIRL